MASRILLLATVALAACGKSERTASATVPEHQRALAELLYARDLAEVRDTTVNGAYGAVIDMCASDSASIVAGFLDGLARVYSSHGQVVLGVPSAFPTAVQDAAKRFVAVADSVSLATLLVPERSPTRPGEAVLTVLTTRGARVSVFSLKALVAGGERENLGRAVSGLVGAYTAFATTQPS